MFYLYQLVRTRRIEKDSQLIEGFHTRTEQVLCLIDNGKTKTPTWYTLSKTKADEAKEYHQRLFPDKEFEILQFYISVV